MHYETSAMLAACVQVCEQQRMHVWGGVVKHQAELTGTVYDRSRCNWWLTVILLSLGQAFN